jgi:hypothetical protein
VYATVMMDGEGRRRRWEEEVVRRGCMTPCNNRKKKTCVDSFSVPYFFFIIETNTNYKI